MSTDHEPDEKNIAVAAQIGGAAGALAAVLNGLNARIAALEKIISQMTGLQP